MLQRDNFQPIDLILKKHLHQAEKQFMYYTRLSQKMVNHIDDSVRAPIEALQEQLENRIFGLLGRKATQLASNGASSCAEIVPSSLKKLSKVISKYSGKLHDTDMMTWEVLIHGPRHQ